MSSIHLWSSCAYLDINAIPELHLIASIRLQNLVGCMWDVNPHGCKRQKTFIKPILCESGVKVEKENQLNSTQLRTHLLAFSRQQYTWKQDWCRYMLKEHGLSHLLGENQHFYGQIRRMKTVPYDNGWPDSPIRPTNAIVTEEWLGMWPILTPIPSDANGNAQQIKNPLNACKNWASLSLSFISSRTECLRVSQTSWLLSCRDWLEDHSQCSKYFFLLRPRNGILSRLNFIGILSSVLSTRLIGIHTSLIKENNYTLEAP